MWVVYVCFRGLELLSIHCNIVLNIGHRIDNIPEVPLVVTDKVQGFSKTKEAVIFLKRDVKAWNDIEQVGLLAVLSDYDTLILIIIILLNIDLL